MKEFFVFLIIVNKNTFSRSTLSSLNTDMEKVDKASVRDMKNLLNKYKSKLDR